MGLTRHDIVGKDGESGSTRRCERGVLVFVAQGDVGDEPECLLQQVNRLAVDLVDVAEGGEAQCELQVSEASSASEKGTTETRRRGGKRTSRTTW